MQALAKAGIDLIEISSATYEAPAMSGGLEKTKKASTMARVAYFLELAAKARTAVDVFLMVTGGFRSVAGMNAALASDALDIVGVARLMAVDLGFHCKTQFLRSDPGQKREHYRVAGDGRPPLTLCLVSL